MSDPGGNVLCQASTRYDLKLESLEIHSAVDDGIFEPNEQVLINGVLVTNTGGLPLPAGTHAYMKSSKTIKFTPFNYELPEILPGQQFVIPATFYGRIFDQPPPNDTGPFVSEASFKTRMNMLGRPFEHTRQKRKLVVQYPVKLAYLKCDENLGRGEVGKLVIGIQNISTMPYGDCNGSGGRVSLQIHMDGRILPVGAANTGFSTVPYNVTFDPNVRDSMYVQLQEIPPGQTVQVEITIQMESRAELFDRCMWQADLYLRDKLIEYNFDKIRVSPFYMPTDPPADVLMVTCKSIARKEFVFWQRILETLSVNVAFWDTDRYNGFSVDTTTNERHPVTWIGAYPGRMILYPYCDLPFLHPADIATHFHGKDYAADNVSDLNSSMVLFLPGPNTGDKSVLRHISEVLSPIEVPEGEYSGFHLFRPGSCFVTHEPYLKWEKKQLKKMEKEDPSRAPVVHNRSGLIESVSFLKYSYGTVDIRRVPILRSCKFMVVDGADGSLTNMSVDDPNLTTNSTDIPIGSNFAQVYLVLLSGLPLKLKMTLLKSFPEEPDKNKCNFFLPTGMKLNKAEVIMCCIAHEVADEVYNCAGTVNRMTEFAKDITDNPQGYAAVGKIILQGMDLITSELAARKTRVKHPEVGNGADRILSLCSDVRSSLQESGVDGADLDPLPSLNVLLDFKRIFRSNQHMVEDNHWDLV